MANTTKNGYEIRADLLGLAKNIAEFNYHVKLAEYEASVKKDGEQVVTEFKYPLMTAESIIDEAKKFNEFVTNSTPQYNETAKLLMENVTTYSNAVQKQIAENMNPEKIQENVQKFQDNVKKSYETFVNGTKK